MAGRTLVVMGSVELKQRDEHRGRGDEGGPWKHAERAWQGVRESDGSLRPREEEGGMLSQEEGGTTNTKAQRLERNKN